MTNEILQIYSEIIDFIAAHPSMDDLANFQLSAKNSAYINTLLDANRTRRLTDAEAEALALYDHLEHVLTMFKATARLKLKERQFIISSENKPQ